MNEDRSKEALSEIGSLSGKLVTRPGSTEEDAIVVGSALMQAAEMIFLQLGGPRLAATQFRDVADRLSAQTH
jgi:hypothetical protein